TNYMRHSNLFEPFETKLQAETGSFYPTERNPRIDSTMFINPCGSGFKTGCNLLTLFEISAPYRGPQSDIKRVCPLDGLLQTGIFDNRQRRSKLFFRHQWVVMRNICNEGGWVEITGLFAIRIATNQDASAIVLSSLD